MNISGLPFGLSIEDGEEESNSTASFIGIIVAISGNILISLALNCQKLAHLRLERERHALFNSARGVNGSTCVENTRQILAAGSTDNDETDDEERTRVGEPSHHRAQSANAESDDDESFPFPGHDTPTRPTRSIRDRAHSLLLETEPLLVVSSRSASLKRSYRDGYESRRSRNISSETGEGSWRARSRTRSSPNALARIFTSGSKGKSSVEDSDLEASVVPVDVHVNGGNPTSHRERSTSKVRFASEPAHEKCHDGNESDYLKSKLWWFGFLLMNVGEMGNFISYAFAPASVVAPLGTFALIANCLFAPLMLKERFRKRDLLGVGLAVMGAITVVLSANPSDKRLDPANLIHAITQHAFIVLAALYAAGAVVLVSLSSRRVGQEHVFVDVGACALFGGFTVLSTKAFSSLVTVEWVAVFKEWITYPILAILIGTGVGQIRYLNRALMKFDSKIVIPTQFVLFNLSAIVGSAVLYGDFRKATLHQMVTFLYGCAATFGGVFMLTWGSGVGPDEPEQSGSGGRLPEEEARAAERTGRAQVFVPSASANARPVPIVRSKSSLLVGLSPAQRVLLSRSPADGT
ncbi:hypothetical protein M0805_007457 [Coniferiporia weirii]|nr:hypothetical protein M0805_007457 [Coniferiporia weirii]